MRTLLTVALLIGSLQAQVLMGNVNGIYTAGGGGACSGGSGPTGYLFQGSANASTGTVTRTNAGGANVLHDTMLVGIYVGGGTSPAITGISDTAGNTYTSATGALGSNCTSATLNNTCVAVYYAKDIAASTANSNTLTVTWSGGGTAVVHVQELSGLSLTTPLDQASALKEATGTTVTYNSITTSCSNPFVYSFSFGSTRTGTNFTLGNYDGGQYWNGYSSYKIPGASGSYAEQVTFSPSSTNAGITVSFK